jgi:hypothetical protein
MSGTQLGWRVGWWATRGENESEKVEEREGDITAGALKLNRRRCRGGERGRETCGASKAEVEGANVRDGAAGALGRRLLLRSPGRYNVRPLQHDTVATAYSRAFCCGS